jgi:hypothetical protein
MQSRLFPDNRLAPPQSREMALRLVADSGDKPEVEEAHAFLHRYVLPPSLRWGFCRNGKTGTTSVLAWLFEVEFGVPLTAHRAPDHTVTEKKPAHQTIAFDLFRPAVVHPGGYEALQTALRIVTVRHPAPRALSGFRYICLADQQGSPKFLPERLRLSAETGFDWRTDPMTARGFGLFLDYVDILHETGDRRNEVVHWRSQFRNLRPDLLAPTVVGRLESLGDLPAQIAPHWSGSLPEAQLGHDNAQPSYDQALLNDSGIRHRLRETFADDFQAFGYDPDHIPAERP